MDEFDRSGVVTFQRPPCLDGVFLFGLLGDWVIMGRILIYFFSFLFFCACAVVSIVCVFFDVRVIVPCGN